MTSLRWPLPHQNQRTRRSLPCVTALNHSCKPVACFSWEGSRCPYSGICQACDDVRQKYKVVLHKARLVTGAKWLPLGLLLKTLLDSFEWPSEKLHSEVTVPWEVPAARPGRMMGTLHSPRSFWLAASSNGQPGGVTWLACSAEPSDDPA